MNDQAISHPTDQTLHAYCSGRLEEASSSSVSRHLLGCPLCQQRANALTPAAPPGTAGHRRVPTHTAVSFVDNLSLSGEAPGSNEPPPASGLPPGLSDHPDYRILRELGQGGMGVVYLAENTLMGRLEVLKVVSGHLVNRKGVLDRFLGEIRNAARLHHPNIVAAYSAIRLGESLVLAMEYVEGFDLSRVVKAKGPLPVVNACYYIYQAALGLQHANEHGMVHRDIKPSNLILARQGPRSIVKVLDFGLAKVQSEGGVDSGLTHEGQMLGTPDYIAPEQITNARGADIRADIYSLGCTFYYLLTGRPPFQGASLYDLLQAHHSMEATPLNLVRPDVPGQVAAIVAKMMAKDADARFQQPREIAQALKPFFQSGDPASAKSQTAPVIATPGIAPPAPVAAPPIPAVSPPGIATLIEPPREMPQGRRFASGSTLPIAAAAAVLALVAVVVGIRMGTGREPAIPDRTAGIAAAAAIPDRAPAPVMKPSPPEDRPVRDAHEDLVRDAMTAVRRGNLHRARLLLDQYLARPGAGKQADAARVLRSEIDLATSSAEAEALAGRLSDQDIDRYLANDGQPLVDGSMQAPEVRRVYAQTLLQAFRREMERRRTSRKDEMALARGPDVRPTVPPAPASKAPTSTDADRPATTITGPDGDDAPAPAKGADRIGATTIETILDSPSSLDRGEIVLDRWYKIGTRVMPATGPDGQPIGSTLAVRGDDDRPIGKGDGKVTGRSGYLILDRDLAPILSRAFSQYGFKTAFDPVHKCALTVTVRPLSDNSRARVITIIGLEILGHCDPMQVANRQYQKAFITVEVTPRNATVTYGDGVAWVERLGGEERFVMPLRRKVRDARRRMINDRNNAAVGAAVQAEVARAMNMTIANQQQLSRLGASIMGGR